MHKQRGISLVELMIAMLIGLMITGAVTQAGSGTTTLTGANAYSGATTISAGTLQVGVGGATGQLGTGAITNTASLGLFSSAGFTLTTQDGAAQVIARLRAGISVTSNMA